MTLVASVATALAQPPPGNRPAPGRPPSWDSRGWVQLGERTVDRRVDHDRIDVGRSEGHFNKLTMVVEDSDLELLEFKIVFGDRTEYSPQIQQVFREGQRTRVIDLPPSERVIRYIDIRYRNLPGDGRAARVQVWGWKIGGGPPPAAPQPPPPPPRPAPVAWDSKGWTLLGERTVDGRVDRDRIDVGRYEGRFNKLTIVVEDSDLELIDFSVQFQRGAPWRPRLSHYFREGQRTHAIDFPGDDRTIRHIDLRYRNLPGGGRAKVSVYGLRSDGGNYWDQRGWTMIGEQRVDGRRRQEDRDRIRVSRFEPRFRQLTVVVLDSDLELLDMAVQFRRGEPWHPQVNRVFRENSRTQVIDLPGDQRTIREIEFRYRNLPGDGRPARVQVWAR